MDLDDVSILFSERPFKMTSLHKGLIVRLIAVARAADAWADSPEDGEAHEHLLECVTDLRDFDE